MTTQHTQGPWHRNIPPASKYSTIFAGRNTHVCRLVVTGLQEGEIESNCNLIVAAPDLLKACKSLNKFILNQGLANQIPEIYMAWEAIAKAEGRDQ